MSLEALWRGVRPHQWAKNTIIFLPALAAHLQLQAPLGLRLLLGLVAFSAVASAFYLINDIADADDDRLHPTKRYRPIAAGQMSARLAVRAAVALAAVGATMALLLSPSFAGVLAAYAVGTAAYTAGLKRYAIVDVITLATLYATRIVAGAVLVEVPLSRWFLVFSIFLFGSLALLKRVIETKEMGARYIDLMEGRGYNAQDIPVLTALGTSFAGVTALVYCVYITGDDVTTLYQAPHLLWLGLPMLVYWIVRLWLLGSRGKLDGDPIAFASRDVASYVVLAGFVVTVWLAT